MTRLRPIARDDLAGNGWPVVASQQGPHDKTAACRTPVTHSYAALAFYTGGQARVEQRGEWNLGAGDVLVVPAGEPHRMLQVQRAEYWGLAFCVPCFAADSVGELLATFERVRDGAAAVVHVPEARHSYLAGLFRELEALGAEPHERSGARAAVARSLLTLILNEVERASGTALAATQHSSVVVDSLRYIERNCLRRLTLEEVARAVRRSPAYVTSALTQATGRSAGEWMTSGRMAEARRLLLHSDERVDSIAERVGYADATHFIRMFRREHGATPAAWRTEQARPAAHAAAASRRARERRSR